MKFWKLNEEAGRLTRMEDYEIRKQNLTAEQSANRIGIVQPGNEIRWRNLEMVLSSVVGGFISGWRALLISAVCVTS